MPLKTKRRVVAAWTLLTAAYLLLFFSTSLGASGDPYIPRWTVLAVWFILDEVALQWVDGDWRQFTLADRLPIIAGAALQLAAGWLVGRFLLELARADRGLTRLENLVFSLGVGLAAVSLGTLAVGLAGGLAQPLWLAGPIVAIAAYSAWRFRERVVGLRSFAERPGRERSSPSPAGPAGVSVEANPSPGVFGPRWLWLAAPFLVVILLGAVMPSTQFDAREYHLQVPKEWRLAGRITFLPHNVYGNMPLGAEMHALAPMCLWPGQDGWWRGALVGQSVLAAFVPLTALALLAFCQRFFSTSSGVMAVVVYVSVPLVFGFSKGGMIDSVVACYLFLAFYAVALWRVGASDSLAGAVLAGWLAGAAAATKYPALVFVAAPLAAYVACVSLADRRRKIAHVAVFLAAAAAAGGLWYAKNWALAGNPVYPLAYGVFGGKTRTPEKDLQWRKAHAVPADAQGRRYTMQQLVKGVGRVLYESPLHSPLLLPLAAMAFLRRRGRIVSAALLGYFLFVFLAWWLFTHRIDRFWLPGLPLLAVLAGVGADWSGSRAWRRALGVFLAMGLAANLGAAITIFSGDNRFFVPLDSLRSYSALHRHLEEITPTGWTVLLVGDAQPFNLKAPALYNTCFDDNLFESMMKERTAHQRRAELRRRKVAVVAVDWAEVVRYLDTYGYSDYVQVGVFEELVAQGVLQPPWPPFPPGVSDLRDERLPQQQIFPVAGAPVDLGLPESMR